MTNYLADFADDCAIRNHGEYDGCTYAELKGPKGRIAEIRIYEATKISPPVVTVDINPRGLPRPYSRTGALVAVAELIRYSPNGLSPEYKSLIAKGLDTVLPEADGNMIRTAFPLGELDTRRSSWASFEPQEIRLLNKLRTPKVVPEANTPPLEELAKVEA